MTAQFPQSKFDQKIRKLNHQRIILMRRWRLQLLKFCFDQRLDPLHTPLRSEKGRDQALRIIILRTDGKLGDSITSTYLLSGLRALFQDSHLTVVSQPEFKSLFWTLANDYIGFKLKFSNAIKLVIKNTQTYDILINTSHLLSPSAVILSRFIPAAKKISFLNNEWKLFSDHVQFDVNADHITERYRSLFRLLSQKKYPEFNYTYPLEQSAQDRVQDLINQRKSQRPFKQLILLNSFAGARLRNLNLRTTQTIVNGLSREFPECLIVSIGNVGDLTIINRWQAELQSPQWTYFSYGSLDFNAALVAAADLVISPDTSIVHMACALQKKIVAIYREDVSEEKNQKIWGPYGTEFIVVEAPYRATENEDGDINTVNILEVITASQKLLGQP